MKHSKKLFAVVLVLTLAVSTMMISANAATPTISDDEKEQTCNLGTNAWPSTGTTGTILTVSSFNTADNYTYASSTPTSESYLIGTAYDCNASGHDGVTNPHHKFVADTLYIHSGDVVSVGSSVGSSTDPLVVYGFGEQSSNTQGGVLIVDGGTVTLMHNENVSSSAAGEYDFKAVIVNSGAVNIESGVKIANLGTVDVDSSTGGNQYYGLYVTGGKVSSSSTSGISIVGKDYGIYQTGGIIDLTGCTITDTLETGDNNHAGGAIYVATNTSMTLTNCNIQTVDAKTGTGSTPYATLNADKSTIVVNGGTVNITGNGSNYIKGSDNWFDDNDSIGSDPHAYNTALEVNGGTVTVTDMAIDSASSSVVPVKVQDAVVTLNGTTVVGGDVCPTTAIKVTNESNKTAKLTLGGTVNSSDSSVVVNASSTGIDASGSNVTIDIDAGTTIKGSGDDGRVNTGINANGIAAIDIDGGTINAVSYGINATSVPSFSVENATIDVSSYGTSYGIYADDCGGTKGEIKNSSITAESTSSDAFGVYLSGSKMTVGETDTATTTSISATSNAQNHVAYGVKAVSASVFTMEKDATINATHKATNGSATTKAYGIYNNASTVTVNDGAINADAFNNAVENVEVYGIYNATTATSDTPLGTTVNDGTVTVGQTFGNETTNRAYGMFNESGNTLFKNGTVNVYSDHTVDSYGVFVADGHVDMTGGTINMKYDHINGVEADGGSFNMGVEGQLALGTTKGGEGHPYIHFDPAANAGTGKVYGVYAKGGAVELYAGEVDVTGVAGFTAVRVDAGSLQVLTNEKVNPATEDADDGIVFTALANTNGGTAFRAENGTWAIRGNGAKFQAKIALEVYKHIDGALSGGSFVGEMQNNVSDKDLDDLFLQNHYLRNDSNTADITKPSDGTRVTSASVKSMGNNDTCYTVTDAEWELRYALEENNSIKTYTMPVNITLDANAGTFGALPKQGDVDVSVGTHKLDLNGKTLSYGGDGAAAPDNQKAVLHVSATGDLLTITSVAGGKIEYTGANGWAAYVEAGLLTNGKADAATPNGVTMLGTNEYTVYLVGGKYIQNSGTVGTETQETATGIMLAAGSPEVVIDGGTVYGSTNGIRNHVAGTVTVNNGTITGGTDGIWQDANGVTNIYGGTINGTTGDGIKATAGTLTVKPVANDLTTEDVDESTTVIITGGTNGIETSATTTVNGGTITGTANGGIKVTGGIATVKPAAAVMAEDGVTALTSATPVTVNGVNALEVTGGEADVLGGTFNGNTNALNVSGGKANITGGTFKGDGEISGDGEANVDAAVDTAPSFQLDKTITVSGGTLNVGATKATKVDSEIKKTAASTVNLCTDSSFKKLTNSYSTETVAAMLNSGVQFIRDEQNESRNVFERNLLTAGPLTATGAETTGYLTLNGTAVTGITLTDSSNGTAKSYYYDEFYFANNKQQTITLTATVTSEADLRTIVWTVSNGDKMVLTKTEPTVATATGVANTYAVSNTVTLTDLPADTYTVTATAQDNAAMSATYTITVNKRALTDSAVSITAPNQVYAAGTVNTTVTVKVNGKTVPADAVPAFYTVTGNSGTGVETADTSVTATVGASSSAMFVDGTKNVTWKILKKGSTPPPTPGPVGGGDGGAVAPKTYTITCGTGVKADVKSSAAGKTITLTVSEGYENIVVKDADGKAVTVSGNTFTMPASNVTVSVTKIAAATSYDKCDKGEACVLKAFNDLDAWRWYHDGIHYCLDNGVMNGLGNGEFAPTASTTRGMIFTILARLDGVTITSTGNEWYTDGQAWSVKAGVSDGTDPTGNITREQLAAMLYRYAKLKGYDVSVGEDTNILSYDDAFSVSEYAVGAMQWAVGAGIINGDNNNLKPTTGATRAEVATMLMRFCETVVK